MIHARKDYNVIQDPRTANKNDKGIPRDEPVFLLRAQDSLFIQMLVLYRSMADFIGCDERMLQTISAHIELAKLYNLSHPTKKADL
jgi:hypothetical protein